MKKGAKDSKEMKNRALASSPKDILELKQAHIITIKFEGAPLCKNQRENWTQGKMPERFKGKL